MPPPEKWVDVARFQTEMKGIDKAPPFAGARAKIERARKHFKELRRIQAKHLASKWYSQHFTTGEDGVPTVRIEGTLPGFDYATTLGDVVHNLRSALDHMAVDVVRLTPGGNPKDVSFPFAPSLAELEDSIKRANFHRASKDAVDLLRAQKPYRGGNVLLRGLHDLDVQDKHRAVVPALGQTSVQAHVAPGPGGKTIVKMEPFKEPILVFAGNAPLGKHEILSTLKSILELVEGIVDAFETLMIPTSPSKSL